MVSLRPRFAQRAASTAVALALDAWLGDEPLHPHPVALFGTTMTAFERRVWDDRRWPGVAYAACGAGGAAAVGSLLGGLPGGTAAAGYATVAVSCRKTGASSALGPQLAGTAMFRMRK